jgi:hypothetical protein
MMDRGILGKLEVALGQQKSAQAWPTIFAKNIAEFSSPRTKQKQISITNILDPSRAVTGICPHVRVCMCGVVRVPRV